MDPLFEYEDETTYEDSENHIEIRSGTSLLIKGEVEQSESQMASDSHENLSLSRSSSISKSETRLKSYGDLPADPNERYNFLAMEYDALLHDIRAQNKKIEEYVKLYRAELSSRKSESSLIPLKRKIDFECKKVTKLTTQALKIKRMYPSVQWSPIPSNNYTVEVSADKKTSNSSKPATPSALVNSSVCKTTSRTSSFSSTSSNKVRKSNIFEREASKTDKFGKGRPNLPPSAGNVLKESNFGCRKNLNTNSCTNTKPNPKNNGIRGSRNAVEKNKVDKKYSELVGVLKDKENELQDMLDNIEQRLEAHICSKAEDDEKMDSPSSIKYLRRRVSVLQQEQNEFRKHMQSQQGEIENYKQKFIEQRRAIETLELHNRNMQKDINTVISNLQQEYESKLREFSTFPQLLKIERQKLEDTVRDKQEIETKFKRLSKQFTIVKMQLEQKSKRLNHNSLQNIKALQRELQTFKTVNLRLQRERDCLSSVLSDTKTKLQQSRIESDKLLFKTRDQADLQCRLYLKKINDLKSELLESRASNTSLIKQREQVLDDIHMQLNDLKSNFQTSQQQIDTLRAHISSLSLVSRRSSSNDISGVK